MRRSSLLTSTLSLYTPGQTRILSPGWAAATAALMLLKSACGQSRKSSSTTNVPADAGTAVLKHAKRDDTLAKRPSFIDPPLDPAASRARTHNFARVSPAHNARQVICR